MGSQKLEPFSRDISPAEALTEKLELSLLFDGVKDGGLLSPVDRYLENSNRLNKIFIDNYKQKTYTSDLGTLLLLGFVSAVESYMRGIIRGLVQVDEYVQKLVAPQQVTYFAAVNHDRRLLPEALLEGVSFISKFNISKTLKDFCAIGGMSGDTVPKSLEPAFEKYGHICQIRHCCVHRFGLLGADNAFRLNLPPTNLEQPIRISKDALEEISIILEKFVCSLNSHIYSDVLQRSLWMSSVITTVPEVKYKNQWTLDITKDEPRFAQYYDLFAITKSQPSTANLWEEYQRFALWAKQCISTDTMIVENKAKNGEKKKVTSLELKAGKPSGSSVPVVAAATAISGDGFAKLSAAAADVLAAAAAQENEDEKSTDKNFEDVAPE
jgi:hypothetical protein